MYSYKNKIVFKKQLEFKRLSKVSGLKVNIVKLGSDLSENCRFGTSINPLLHKSNENVENILNINFFPNSGNEAKAFSNPGSVY